MKHADYQYLIQTLLEKRETFSSNFPPIRQGQEWAESMFDLLFPVRKPFHKTVEATLTTLESDLRALLGYTAISQPADVAEAFFNNLFRVYQSLQADAEAFYRCDPAATSVEEVLLTYPGFFAVAVHRMAHALQLLNVPLLPRILSEYAHSKTGIDIHPAARIGHSFFVDHGTGVVIGATAEIGNQVKIYQGVTLGALQVEKALANTKRHPTIQDNVVIYANATILGGKTTIGKDSVIGGNTWITESVAPGSVVLHQPQVKVKPKFVGEEIIWVI